MKRLSGLIALLVLAGCSDGAFTDPATADARGGGRLYDGEPVAVGNGTATAFATVLPTGRPTSVGVEMTAATLDGLPTTFSDQRACFDKNGDGTLDATMAGGECVVGHEYVLEFPDQPDLPFQYVMLNFNPMGHIPPGVYDLPHFDIHFYMQDLAEVREIDPGPCPVLTDCDDYARAKTLPDASYYPAGYIDVDAVEPMMGNHLLDPTGPEFNGETFTRTFIVGAYDGEVTFYEPMITRAWLLRRVKNCDPIPQPEAWARSGWYPTSYCTDYKQRRHRITLEDFVYRTATAPA